MKDSTDAWACAEATLAMGLPAGGPLRACASVLLALLAFTSHAGSVNYSYDTLGRLTQAVYSNGTTTTTISYSYDAAGNRRSVVTTSP